MPEELKSILITCVSVILTGLASWLTTYLVSLINSKIKDAKMAKWLTQITQIVMDSVKTITQTFVDTLKKDGKFDEEHQKEAMNKCMELIQSQLTEDAKQFIKDNFGDIQVWLRSQIESMIYSLKK